MEDIIKEVSNEMSASGTETLKNLINIWTEIGYDNTDIMEKIQNFKHKELKFHDEILDENLDIKTKLTLKVDNLGKKYYNLIRSLKLSPHSIVKDESVSIFELEKVLKKEIFQLEKQIEEMQKEIGSLTEEEKKLALELGLPPKKLQTGTELPEKKAINEYKEHITALQNLHFERSEEICSIKEKISEIMEEIGHIPISDDSIQLFSDQVVLSAENIGKLKKWLHELEADRTEVIASNESLRRQLQNLWDRLEENPKMCSDFLEKHQGYRPEVLEAIKTEIARCRAKQQTISKTIVEKLRAEIVQLWEKCRFGVNQRKEFGSFFCNFYNEDLIILHERYIDDLNNFYSENEKIYNLINQHEQLWEEFMGLNENANCADRYKNRGGQLLKEEKRRKLVSNKLPKIEADLRDALAAFEEKKGRQFLIQDQSVIAVIDRQWQIFNDNKNIKSSARKCAQTSTRTFLTPSQSKTQLTPAVSRTRLTPAISKSRLTPAVSKSRLTPAVSQSRLVPISSSSHLPSGSKLTVPMVVPLQKNSTTAKRKILATPTNDAKRAKPSEPPKKIAVKKVIGCKNIRKSLANASRKSNTSRRRSKHITQRKKNTHQDRDISVNYTIFESKVPEGGRSTMMAVNEEEKENECDESVLAVEFLSPAPNTHNRSPRTPRTPRTPHSRQNGRLIPTLPLII